MMQEETRLFNPNFLKVSIATLFMFAAFYMLMPIIAMYIIDQFNADPSVAGVITAAYIITALLVRPFSGYLVDRFDRRKFYIVVFFIFALLFCGYIFSSTLWQLLITRILLGGFFSLVTTAANTLAIDVAPSDKRAKAIGYYSAIVVLSMAIGPMLGLYLIEVASYTQLFIYATICCFCGFVITPFLKTRKREPAPHIPMSLDRFFVRDGLSIALVISLMYFFYGSLMVYVSLYLRECSIDYSSASFFLFFSMGITAARLGVGMLLKGNEQHILLLVGIVTIIISSTLFILFLNNSTYIATSVLMGLGFGLVGPAIQSMIVDLVPASRRGTANSTYFTALDFGSGLGMLAGGTIATIIGYRGLFSIGLTLTILSLLLYLLYARRDHRRRLTTAAEAEA